jgi:hypothetical protein
MPYTEQVSAPRLALKDILRATGTLIGAPLYAYGLRPRQRTTSSRSLYHDTILGASESADSEMIKEQNWMHAISPQLSLNLHRETNTVTPFYGSRPEPYE